MTADQLRQAFNTRYGAEKPWPKLFHVSPETYADVCQSIFEKHAPEIKSNKYAEIALGPHNGIMFKGVELILDYCAAD